MEKITVDLMNDFKYLSSIKSNNKKTSFAYIVHKPNLSDNKYDSNLYLFDGKKTNKLTSDNKVKSFFWEDDENILFPTSRTDEEKKKLSAGDESTSFYRLSLKEAGEANLAFKLPIFASFIKKIDDTSYVVAGSSDCNHPNLYKESAKNREKVFKERKDTNFKVEINEIPFWLNGAGMTNRTRTRIFIFDSKKDTLTPITKDVFLDTNILDVDVKEKKILFSSTNFKNKASSFSEVLEYDIKTKKSKTIIKDNLYGIYNGFYSKKNIFFLASDMKTFGINQNAKLIYCNRSDFKLKSYLNTDISFGNSTGTDVRYGGNNPFSIDYETGAFKFVTTQESKAVLWEITPKKEIKQIINDEGSVDGFAYINDELYVIGYYNNNLCEIYKHTNKKLKKVTSYNEEVMKNKYVATPKKIKIKSNNDDINGWVLLPKDFDKNKKYPAILDIHGGPKTVYGELYYHEMQVWANEGYFVMFTNPHGSDGRGDKFSDIRGKYGTIDYEDLMNFVDEVIKKYPNIDTEKLGVTGGSYGGFMTNWVVTHTNRFKVAATQRSISNWVSMYGVSDIGYFFSDDQNAADLKTSEGFDKIWEHSPLKYIHNAKTPTLVIHAEDDFRCPVDQGYQFFTALKDNGIDAKMVVFKGENHDLSRSGKPKARLSRLNYITDWMKEYLNK